MEIKGNLFIYTHTTWIKNREKEKSRENDAARRHLLLLTFPSVNPSHLPSLVPFYLSPDLNQKSPLRSTMVTGWRRAFCTSIRKEDRDTIISSEKQPQSRTQSSSPRISSKLGFFSTPSTPSLRSQPVSGPRLQCRTATADLKLQRKTAAATSTPKKRSTTTTSTTNSSNTFHTSSGNPSPPKSPSSFSFLRASLRIFRVSQGCLRSPCWIPYKSLPLSKIWFPFFIPRLDLRRNMQSSNWLYC